MNFVWMRSIITAFKNGEINRARFIREWENAQSALNKLAGRANK